MKQLEKIQRTLREQIGESAVTMLCEKLLMFLVKEGPGAGSMLTYRHIAEIVGVEPESASLQSAVSVLSMEQIGVLTLHMFLTLDDFESEVSADDLRVYFKTGELSDPRTGEPLDHPDEALVPFFVATDGLSADAA